MKSENRICQNCKQSFEIYPEDFKFYQRIKVPPPTFCPQCRFQRRAAFRNERNLYRTKSAFSGKDILTIYPADLGTTVYEEKEWWSDAWDPFSYGVDYDFSRPFFEQFFELARKVPRVNRNVLELVNSEYSANTGRSKNCYLIFNSNDDEDCAYGNGIDLSKNCFDNSHITKCERCYQSVRIKQCYNTYFSFGCVDCIDVWFSKNCRGCSYCFGCVNLRNQKYCWFNEQLTKEEYEKRLTETNLDTWKGNIKAKNTAQEFWKKFPVKYMEGTKNVNVSGEYISNSRNVKDGYIVIEGENLRYVQYLQFLPPTKDSYDLTVWGENNQLAYENMECGNGTFNVHFSQGCYFEVKNIEYSSFCMSSSDLFGCVGLRKKQYCIFNKQYKKEQYENLREKIIKHMSDRPYVDEKGRIYKYGEFFPIELSPLHYNRTLAMQHFPISKEEAQQNNYHWYDMPPSQYAISIKGQDLPESIKNTSKDITEEVISCIDCGHAYRIIEPEYIFLQKENIALPRQCVDCRHNTRISLLNKSKLYSRTCMCNKENHLHGTDKCEVEFETSYSPDRPEIIYCEKCYQQEVY